MSNFDDIFESAPQTDEFDKEAWAAKKKAERDELYALADATAEAVCADGGKFREYLDVQAAFRNYSATNALLILATKPDACRLGDKDFWRDQGVYIKRQEFGRPIKIVESNGEYTRDDGSIGVSYNIKRVYDISQTTAGTRAPQAVSHAAVRFFCLGDPRRRGAVLFAETPFRDGNRQLDVHSRCRTLCGAGLYHLSRHDRRAISLGVAALGAVRAERASL